MGILNQTESFLTACSSLVTVWCMIQTSRDRNNSRRVRTHEKNSGETVRRLGTIIQSIFCAQSGTGIPLNFWKWLGESRYPGAFSPLLETFVVPFLPTRLTAPGSPRMSRRLKAICEKVTSWMEMTRSYTVSSKLKIMMDRQHQP